MNLPSEPMLVDVSKVLVKSNKDISDKVTEILALYNSKGQLALNIKTPLDNFKEKALLTESTHGNENKLLALPELINETAAIAKEIFGYLEKTAHLTDSFKYSLLDLASFAPYGIEVAASIINFRVKPTSLGEYASWLLREAGPTDITVCLNKQVEMLLKSVDAYFEAP